MKHLGFSSFVARTNCTGCRGNPSFQSWQLIHPLACSSFWSLHSIVHTCSSSCKNPLLKFSRSHASPSSLLQLITTTLLQIKHITWLGFQEFTQLLPKPTSRHISVLWKQIKLHYFCLHIFPAFPLLPICLLSSFPLSFPKLDFKPLSWLDSIHHWNSFLLPHP